MRVFISWSKSLSHEYALLLRDWLPQVIQQVTPWVSSEDIAKGKRWSGEIAKYLDETGQGLLAVTRQNTNEPWLNFEAGALAKSVEDARVTPIVLDLAPRELVGPLAEFQAASASDRTDMRRLVESLNEVCRAPLSAELLSRAFDRAWSDYASELDKLLKRASATALPSDLPATPKRTTEDMVGEVLDRVRALERSLKTSHAEVPRRQGVPARPHVNLTPSLRANLRELVDQVLAENAPPREIEVSPSGRVQVTFAEKPDVAALTPLKESLIELMELTGLPLRVVSLRVLTEPRPFYVMGLEDDLVLSDTEDSSAG